MLRARLMTLTANGQLLLPVIREILHQEDKLFELSAQMNGLLIGTVTINGLNIINAMAQLYMSVIIQ